MLCGKQQLKLGRGAGVANAASIHEMQVLDCPMVLHPQSPTVTHSHPQSPTVTAPVSMCTTAAHGHSHYSTTQPARNAGVGGTVVQQHVRIALHDST